MSGVVINVAPFRTYDFSDLPESGEINIQIAERIDVTPWREGTLVVRPAELTLDTGDVITVRAVRDPWTPEDLAGGDSPMGFGASNIMAAIALNDAPSQADVFQAQALSANFGQLLLVLISVTRGETATGTCSTRLNIDLVMKD